MDINAGTLAGLTTGYRTAFNAAFTSFEPAWNQVAMEVTSTTSSEKYPWLGQVPKLREWIGDRVVQNLKTYNWEIANKKFEQTVGVPRDTIDDDQFGVYTPLMAEMGRAAAEHPDELVFAMLKSGFATDCYDGQYFFDTDHPVVDANGVVQSVSNDGGGSGEPWFLIDDTRMIKPLIYQKRRAYAFKALANMTDENVFWRDEYIYGTDGRSAAGFGLWQLAYGSKSTLDAAGYEAARKAMLGMTGDHGRPLGLRPSLLVVGPANEGPAREILNAERNDAGATNVWRGTAKLLVTSWLA